MSGAMSFAYGNIEGNRMFLGISLLTTIQLSLNGAILTRHVSLLRMRASVPIAGANLPNLPHHGCRIAVPVAVHH
jgi:hypothetical protein